MYKFLLEHMFSHLQGWDYCVMELPVCFPKGLYHFVFCSVSSSSTPAMSPGGSISSPGLNWVGHFNVAQCTMYEVVSHGDFNKHMLMIMVLSIFSGACLPLIYRSVCVGFF